MHTIDELRSTLNSALKAFDHDPADSQFQEGYKAALEAIRAMITEKEVEPAQ